MRNKLIVLLVILLITGCSDKNTSNTYTHQNTAKEPNIAEQQDETIYISKIEFPLYKVAPDGYNYVYVNDNITVRNDVIIDNENKKVYDRLNNKELDYDEYSRNNPTRSVINFVLLRNECRRKAACDSTGCSISNYMIQDLQYMIDPVNGITPDYLLYEWCPININDDLINELNNDGYKVWGRELANSEGKSTPLSIAIEVSHLSKTDRKILLEKYGLLDLFDTSPSQYFGLPLNSYVCKENNLTCKEVN